MKASKMIVWMLTGMMLAGMVSGCGQRKAPAPDTGSTEPETCFTAVERYLADSLGCQYSPGAFSIPFCPYVAMDEHDPEDILVWGDFWVLNYNPSGDTLKTVSGGSHPGLMHVRKEGDGHFEVTQFEAVGDGSLFMPTARHIFGDKYDAFMAVHSDENKREAVRKEAVEEFVRRNDLAVKYYQDFGWPAVPLSAR